MRQVIWALEMPIEDFRQNNALMNSLLKKYLLVSLKLEVAR